MKHKIIRLVFLTGAIWTAGALLRADTIAYAVTNGSGVLGTIDLNTGVFTQIAAPGLTLSSVYGLGEYNGGLYGASIACGCLFQLNPTTGAVTNTPIPFSHNGNTFGSENGFGSTTGGLFAVGAAFGGLNSLYSVDPVSGAPTLIGSTAITAGGGTGYLSASNDSSKLFWETQNGCFDSLYSLSTSTGAATLIATTSECFPSKTGNPFSMVYVGGTLWSNFYGSGFGTIDTATGAQTLVSTNVFPAYAGLAPYPLGSTVLSGSRFVPITPCRVADTRNAAGPFGGPAINGNATRNFTIPNGSCNIPSTATAFSLNAAVVPHATLGYITVWPAGQPQPLVATLNSLDGRIKVNAAIVPAGTGGAISVFTTDATELILDINGYFVPASDPSGLAFYPLTPCRIADTRNAAGPLGGPSLAAAGNRTFPIVQGSCGIPASAKAYSLNFAAVPPKPLGYLTAWPTGQTQPLAASLSAVTGAITANAVVVSAGTNGSVDVYASDATDLVIDVNGYFASPGAGGLSLYALTPCRVLDSRQPTGSSPFSGTRDVNVTASGCGTPANAQAYVFNATVVPPGPFGYLTLWPQGQAQPLAATLNAVDGALTSNMAIVPTTNGSISAFALNPTHLVLDLFAYFAP